MKYNIVAKVRKELNSNYYFILFNKELKVLLYLLKYVFLNIFFFLLTSLVCENLIIFSHLKVFVMQVILANLRPDCWWASSKHCSSEPHFSLCFSFVTKLVKNQIQFVHLFIIFVVCFFVFMFIYLFLYLFIYQCIYLFFFLSFFPYLFISLFIYLFNYVITDIVCSVCWHTSTGPNCV